MEYILVFFLYTTDGQLIDKRYTSWPTAEACWAEQRRLETRQSRVAFAACVPR